MKKTMSLNGAWRLSGPDGVEVEAHVPGEVHVDLHRAGVIPDPYYGLNAQDLRWIDEKDWIYSRRIEVNKDFLRRKTFLEFDGLDMPAAVLVNDQEVGRARGPFIPHRFDVTGLVRPGTNIVTVRFQPQAVLENRSNACGMQGKFGCGSACRFINAGIRRDARLASYDRLSISDIHVEPEVVGGCAEAWIEIEIENHTGAQALAAVSVVAAYGDNREKIELVESVAPSGGVVEAVVRVEEPELWWPNGFGEQPLYTLMVGVQHESEVQDVAETRFGVRSAAIVERDRDGSDRFTFLINGHEVFCKGADWIPADCFMSNVTAARYKDLVRLAADAGFNVFRVRGGIYEHPAFYEACDEMGIMVWQDLVFREATNQCSDGLAPLIAREAEAVVKRLRKHPCVVLWCGNGGPEVDLAHAAESPDSPLLRETVPDVLKRFDHTRPYRASAPYDGGLGEASGQGGSWLRACLGDHTRWRHIIEQDRAPFAFGFCAQGAPDVESAKRFIPAEDLFPPTGAVWEFHSDLCFDSPGGQTQHQMLVDFTRRMMGEFVSAEEFAAFSGILQGEFVKAQIEHFRREKWAISGALYRSFNEAWPTIGSSLVDYYGRPKPAYYYAKRACAPVIVSFKQLEDRLQAHVTSDERLREFEGLLRVGVLTFEACGLDVQDIPVKLSANGSGSFWESAPIGELLSDPAGQCVVAILYSRDTIVAKNFWFALPFGQMRFPRPKLLVERRQVDENRHRMVIAADGFARNVFFGGLPDSARPSDNYFDLLPGEAYEITIERLSVEEANELRIGTWGR